jgi:hypothetical protein
MSQRLLTIKANEHRHVIRYAPGDEDEVAVELQRLVDDGQLTLARAEEFLRMMAIDVAMKRCSPELMRRTEALKRHY